MTSHVVAAMGISSGGMHKKLSSLWPQKGTNYQCLDKRVTPSDCLTHHSTTTTTTLVCVFTWSHLATNSSPPIIIPQTGCNEGATEPGGRFPLSPDTPSPAQVSSVSLFIVKFQNYNKLSSCRRSPVFHLEQVAVVLWSGSKKDFGLLIRYVFIEWG